MVARAVVCAMCLVCVSACSEPQSDPDATAGDGAAASVLAGISEVVPGIFNGPEPVTDASFDELKALGVRTVLSVDAVGPDVDRARARGIRYVHVPIGYDELSDVERAQLVRALAEAERPIYVHCHYGRHRGPTAAAVGLIGCGEMTNDQALAFLERAGTSARYEGLWASVRTMVAMSAEEAARVGGELVERAEVNSIAQGMAVLDRALANLDDARFSRWDLRTHPDLVLAHEAGMIADAFRAMIASDEMERMDDLFGKKMAYTMSVTEALEQAVLREPFDAMAVEAELDRLDGTCTDCHSVYRD